MIKPIVVDLQYDFTRPEGKHFKPSRTCLTYIRDQLLPALIRQDIKIGEIISDYRQPRPGDLDDSCNPGTWGYTSEIPETLVSTRWVKCMNSPFFIRDNIGVADKPPGLPRAFPEFFYDWLASFVHKDDTVVLFGLTLDCCVLCTAQAMRFMGYDVWILLDATDTYDGGEKSRRQTMDLVVRNWAKPLSAARLQSILGEVVSDIPWSEILSLDCSEIYRRMFQKLKDSGNEPIRGGELTGPVIMRIQQANQVLKHSGLGFAIRSVESPREVDMWNRHFRLVRRD
jgi:hypothetical protein